MFDFDLLEAKSPSLLEDGGDNSRLGGPSRSQILCAAGNPLRTLGLEPGASSVNVRRAYHRLALLYHPDKAGDPDVFRAISAAYRFLTDAKSDGGWRDLDGQAIGPWPAHGQQVNVVHFDCFGAPPWESRRLYTGCWDEGKVRCWELSRGEVGRASPPRLVGEIEVGGFLNDLAAVSPHGLLTAQSAGMFPQPGESLRVFDLNDTPFRAPKRALGRNALEDAGAVRAGVKTKRGFDAGAGAELATAELALSKAGSSTMRSCDLKDSQMVELHYRGARALSLWPKPDGYAVASPLEVASISKDMLGVSRLNEDGCSLERPAAFAARNPHDGDANALCWESRGLLWSGGNDARMKLWAVDSGREEALRSVGVQGGSQIYAIEAWPEVGVAAAAHTSGIAFVDTRSGRLIRQQYTKSAVRALRCLREGHPLLFVGLGSDLTQYDTRMFADGKDTKPKAVGQWSLRSTIHSISLTTSAKGGLLVAAGCSDGKVAAFDTQ